MTIAYETESLALTQSQREELYLFLGRHGKQSMLRTVMRLSAGASITDLTREGSAFGGDARAIENLAAGRLVHSAATWQRRTARAARCVIEHEASVDPTLARNARAVLAAVDLLV